MGVSNTGTVTTVTKGKSVVTAADKKNTAHFDQTEVGITSLVMGGTSPLLMIT